MNKSFGFLQTFQKVYIISKCAVLLPVTCKSQSYIPLCEPWIIANSDANHNCAGGIVFPIKFTSYITVNNFIPICQQITGHNYSK